MNWNVVVAIFSLGIASQASAEGCGCKHMECKDTPEKCSEMKKQCMADKKNECPNKEKSGMGSTDSMTIGDIKGKVKGIGKKDDKKEAKGGPAKDPMADVRARHKPCHDDFTKLCKDGKTGHDAMTECLNLNKEKLSEECRKVLPEIEAMHGKK